MKFLLAVVIVFTLSTTQTAFAQTKLAFVSGIERYDKSGLRDLDYAEEDARQVQAALKSLGFSVVSVIGDEATLANLNFALERFIAQAKKLDRSDIVIVYFSGHGVQKLVQRRNDDGKSIEVEEPFFCPKDALKSDPTTLLSLNTLLRRLEDSSGSDHNIIMLDACRDSSDKGAKGGIDGSTIEVTDKLALFFAAKSGRRSFESAQLQHGIFTHYLLEGLSGQAADSDNEVTFHGLVNYVAKQVERNSPSLLNVSAVDAQRPNLMGNLSGTIVLGRADRQTHPQNAWAESKSFSNELGMQFVRIEPGEFMMGNAESGDDLAEMFPYAKEKEFEDAANQHLVKITRPYYIGAHEVTVGQFRAFVKATGYRTDAEKGSKGGTGLDLKAGFNRNTKYNWDNTGCVQTDEHPVVNVSWNDTQQFIAWLCKVDGRNYRLPTEAEWEYACRAGTQTLYWNGNDPEGLPKIANIADPSFRSNLALIAGNFKNSTKSDDGFAFSAPVGSYPPNPWGLYDMHGNVWEWCSDWYGEYPTGTLSDWRGSTFGTERVDRGGGWWDAPSTCRSAHRSSNLPSDCLSNLGFRVVLDSPGN